MANTFSKGDSQVPCNYERTAFYMRNKSCYCWLCVISDRSFLKTLLNSFFYAMSSEGSNVKHIQVTQTHRLLSQLFPESFHINAYVCWQKIIFAILLWEILFLICLTFIGKKMISHDPTCFQRLKSSFYAQTWTPHVSYYCRPFQNHLIWMLYSLFLERISAINIETFCLYS